MDFLPADRPFLIAEAGVNHNGKEKLALELVDAAKDAGADAVKFQTFSADKLAAAGAPKAEYQKRAGSGSQRDMLRALELSREAHRAVVKRCERLGLRFMSTPFDEDSADFLESLGMELFKVPSGEVTNHALLAHIGAKKKPVILSTGMSDLSEVRAAVDVLSGAGAAKIVVLHCVSNYPAADADVNLRAMKTMGDDLGLPAGYSDHTLGLEISFAAAALGARVIEKHFTLDKKLPGPDHAMSLNPAELKRLASGLRRVASSLGDGVKAPRPSELEVRSVARRSVVLAKGAKAGMKLSEARLALKRPATGIPANELPKVIGRTLARDLPADTILQWDMLR